MHWSQTESSKWSLERLLRRLGQPFTPFLEARKTIFTIPLSVEVSSARYLLMCLITDWNCHKIPDPLLLLSLPTRLQKCWRHCFSVSAWISSHLMALRLMGLGHRHLDLSTSKHMAAHGRVQTHQEQAASTEREANGEARTGVLLRCYRVVWRRWR